jgi:hypothetical protein
MVASWLLRGSVDYAKCRHERQHPPIPFRGLDRLNVWLKSREETIQISRTQWLGKRSQTAAEM